MTHEFPVCPECEKGTLRPIVYSDVITYNGKPLQVDELEGCLCDVCGADPVLPDQARRNSARFTDARRRADGLLVGEEIRAIREQLGLSQADAAALFGGGPNAFSKYERGEVMQSVAMDRLLKVTVYVPGALEFLCEEAGVSCPGGGSFDYTDGPAYEIGDMDLGSAALQGEGVVVSMAEYRERRVA